MNETRCNQTGAVIRVINCFVCVRENVTGWNGCYCTEVLLMCTLSLINAILLSYLLCIDIKTQRSIAETTWKKEYLKKPKSWILILGVLLNTL